VFSESSFLGKVTSPERGFLVLSIFAVDSLFFKKAQKSRICGNRVQVSFPGNSLSSAASRIDP